MKFLTSVAAKQVLWEMPSLFSLTLPGVIILLHHHPSVSFGFQGIALANLIAKPCLFFPEEARLGLSGNQFRYENMLVLLSLINATRNRT